MVGHECLDYHFRRHPPGSDDERQRLLGGPEPRCEHFGVEFEKSDDIGRRHAVERCFRADVDPGCGRRFGVGTRDLNNRPGGCAFEFFAQPADARAEVCEARSPAGLAYRRPVSAATGTRQHVVGRQPDCGVAGLTADQCLTRPTRQDTGSPGDVANTDHREVGVPYPVDQRGGDKRLLPGLLVRSIDEGDRRPCCPLAGKRGVDDAEVPCCRHDSGERRRR